MADGYVQVPVDQTGKKIDTTELTTTVGTVERQRVEIPDEVQVSGNDLSAMLIEQRVQNLLLAQGFGFRDDLDELRNTVSAAALTVAFLQLTDAPSSYTGFGGYSVAVNTAEDGVEFVAATSGSITVGTTPIASGTTTHVIYDNAAVVGEAANFTIISGNPNVTTGNSYLYNGLTAISAQTALHNFYAGVSGNLTASGSNNMAMGDSAMLALTSGADNTAIGYSALNVLQDGSNNLAFGSFSMLNNVSASQNIAIGAHVMGGLTAGANNISIGYLAMSACTAANDCIAIGTQTLLNMASNSDNTAVGHQALLLCNGADSNVAYGSAAGATITSGAQNLCLGRNSGVTSSGSQNIEIGYSCQAPSATASGQLSIGNYIYGTGLTGTTTTISTGKIGIGVKAPACQLDVDGTVKTKVYTVATLPTAGVQGARALVTDATVTTFATVVAGTGGNIVPVFDDGTNWRIG